MSTTGALPLEVAGRLAQFPAMEHAIAAHTAAINSKGTPMTNEVNVLNALVAFYHSETMWVLRTRASMELVLAEAPPISAPSPTSSTTTESEDAIDRVLKDVDVVLVKGKHAQNSTLLMRRKKGFKLRLDGISTTFQPKVKEGLVSCKAISSRASTPKPAGPPPASEVLDMFEQLLQSRMDSCMRLERMVRECHAPP